MGTAPFVVKYKYAYNSLQPSNLRNNYYIQDNHMSLNSPLGASVHICTIFSGQLSGDASSTLFPTLLVQGVSYTNVYRFHVGSFGNYKYGDYYMKQGIGIIKEELYTNETVPKLEVYELVRYHIE